MTKPQGWIRASTAKKRTCTPAASVRCRVTPLREEIGDDPWHVAVLDICRIVERSHVICRDASGEALERNPDLRILEQRGSPSDRRGLVRRKVVAVVLELEQIERADQS